MFYWIMLKNGNLQIQDREPRGRRPRPYVAETSREVVGDFQHYVHELVAWNGVRRVLHTRCGYDRGPVREGVVKRMLTGAIG